MTLSLYPCPCCGYLTLEGPPATDNHCPVCGWQDDLAQLRFAATRYGPNGGRSLVDAQKNFAEYGTSKPGYQPRHPSPEGIKRDKEWRPIDLDRDNIELSSVGDQGRTYPQDRTTLYYWRETYWRKLR